MGLVVISAMIFLAGYFINIFYITVLYHRGITHNSVKLHRYTRRFLVWTGSWVTGIDPKAWACMHRLHHLHSDTDLDPHSPTQFGVFGVMIGQLRSYEKTLRGLLRGRKEYVNVVQDLEFPVHWLNRRGLWWLPYALHVLVAMVLGFAFHSILLGTAYWLGIMSHPLQGWMVNSFAHRFGYQNHVNGDQSRNNFLVAWLVMGEGYQNNHHAFPDSAKFSQRWFEFDGGYVMCTIAEQLNMLSIKRRPAYE